MSADDYLIREATAADTDKIVDLIRKHYMSQESIFQSYIAKHRNEINDSDTEQLINGLTANIRELLQGNPTLVLEHRASKAVIGQIIMEPQKKPSTPVEKKTIEYKEDLARMPKEVADLVKHLEDINLRANLYNTFPGVGKSLRLRYLGVHSDHRRKGLSIMLLRAGIDYARRNNYFLAHGIFSSVISQSSAEAAGLTCTFKCHLNDIKDDRGEPAFANVNPDTYVCVMVIEPAKKIDDGIAKYFVH